MFIKCVKDIIKQSVNLVGKLLGKQIVIAPKQRRNYELFDFNMVSAYWNRDEEVVAYEQSMNHIGMGWSDNLSKRCRYYSLYQVANMALDRSSGDGDVAECGCWQGHSAHMVATILKNRKFQGKMHIFDSFEGLSELTDKDINERWILNKTQVREQKELLAASEELVRSNLSDFDFIEYYAGWIPSRFEEVAERNFILVHLDVDLYEPFRDSIDFFYPRLRDGGAIVFDDYGLTQFPGAKLSIDEAVQKLQPSHFYKIPTGGAFLIK